MWSIVKSVVNRGTYVVSLMMLAISVPGLNACSKAEIEFELLPASAREPGEPDPISSANRAPVLGNDVAAVAEDASVMVSVLSNDGDPDGDAITVSSVSAASNGSVSASGGNITYTPSANFFGSDTFIYSVSDGKGGAADGVVNVTVTAVSDAPVAVTDTENAVRNVAKNISVKSNDFDSDGDTLTVTAVSAPANGTTSINGDNTVSYTPALNYTGPDTFTYTLSDGVLTSIGTVNMMVNMTNVAPSAVNDSVSVLEDSFVNIAVKSNDSDPDGDAITVSAVGAASNGAVVINGDQTVKYTPTGNFSGADSFTYTINDGLGGVATATVSVTVTAVNDAPVAVNGSATTNEDTAVAATLSASDLEGSALVYTIVSAPAGGLLSGTAPALTYTPNANWNGADSFTFRVSDSALNSNIATYSVTVTPVADNPIAVNDPSSTTRNSAKILNVKSNDSDPDGNALTITAVSVPTSGTAALNGDQTITYTPNLNFTGADSFTYTISDGTGRTATGTVSMSVNASNTAPVANNDSATFAEDTATSIAVIGNDTDGESDPLTVTAVSAATNGTPTINGDNTVTYAPSANWSGADSFTYTVSDGNGGTATATVSVTVTAVNDIPVATAQAVSTNEDTSKTITLAGTDVETAAASLTYAVVAGPANGTLNTTTGSSIIYTPSANYNGSDSFTFRVNDGTANSTAATVSITVVAINDNPVAVNDAGTTAEDTSLTLSNLKANDSDPEGSALSISSVGAATNGTVTLNGDNTVTYAPSANWSGADSFTYTVSDGNGGTATATVSVTVTAVNDIPVATAQAVSTNEDTSKTITLAGTDVETAAASLTYAVVAGPANGTLNTTTGSSIIYTPNANYNGSDSFTFRVNDGTANSTAATVSITVVAVNDNPVAVNDSATANNAAIDIDVKSNDSDVEGDALTVSAATNGSNGTVVINANQTVKYTPNASYSGADSFTYTLSDGNGGSATATVSMTVIGPATQLAFTQQPSAAASAGQDFSTQPKVAARDASGATVSSAHTITLAAYTDNTCSTLSTAPLDATTSSVATSAGVATFAGVDHTKAESLYLKATSGVLTSACSSLVTVSAASPSKLVLTGPTSALASACSTAFTVTTKDAYNNVSAVTAATAVALSGGGAGSFYADACVTASSSRTLNIGESSFTFYFQSAATGNLTLDADDGAAGLTNGTLAFSVVLGGTPGTLDTGFDTDGKLSFAVGTAGDALRAVTTDADGKILVGGYANSGNDDFLIARLTADGSFDSTFGTGGKRTIALSTASDQVAGIAAIAGGKILAGGDQGGSAAVVRLNNDGSDDTTFGTSGKSVVTLTGAVMAGMAIDSTGKILLGGTSDSDTTASSNNDFTVVRLTSAGAIDTSFNGSGIAYVGNSTHATAPSEFTHAIIVQSDDKPVIGGGSNMPASTSDKEVVVARLTSAGVLDTTFGTGGKFVHNFGTADDRVRGIAQDGSGRLVIVGQAGPNWFVGRLTTAGAWDTTFNVTGYSVIAPPAGAGRLHAVSIQDDGKIVAAGYADSDSTTGTNQDMYVLRFDSTGSYDTTFNPSGTPAGVMFTPIATGTGGDQVHAITLVANKIIAVGQALFTNLDAGIIQLWR